MVLVATARELRPRGHYTARRVAPDLLALLDLVALATVCDVVPLKGLNRAYVTKGLQVMRHAPQHRPARRLIDAAGLAVPPTPYHLGFVLGPRINAGGRIGDAGARRAPAGDRRRDGGGAHRRRCSTSSTASARRSRRRCWRRRWRCADRLVEADPDVPLLLLGSETWHKGVVGLVASRLVERFRRPACVIAWDGKRRGHRLAALHRWRRYRRGGAGGGGGWPSQEGRRPCHGGGPDRGARRSSRRCEAFLRERLAASDRGRARGSGARSSTAR